MNATNTTTQDPQIALEVAQTVRGQVELGIFWSLGAHNYRAESIGQDPALGFDAKILPMTKSGSRGTAARTMHISIALTWKDYYNVRVTYAARGTGETAVHFEREDVDAFTLPHLLLALDFDGDEVLNPRYCS